MHALVTGGRFIGSNLVRLLTADGVDVTVLDNLTSGYRENLATGQRRPLRAG
jgi:nucleoside-diphosphate-sugar epimerase